MKTMKDWKTDLSTDFQPGDEIDEEMYYYNLSVMPPIYIKNGFQVSEPYDHSDNGHATYSTFINRHEYNPATNTETIRYFYMGNLSTRQAQELA